MSERAWDLAEPMPAVSSGIPGTLTPRPMNSLRNNIDKDGHHILYAGWQDTLRVDLLVTAFPRLVFASAKFAACRLCY